MATWRGECCSPLPLQPLSWSRRCTKQAKGLEGPGEQEEETLGEGRVGCAHQEGGYMENPKREVGPNSGAGFFMEEFEEVTLESSM